MRERREGKVKERERIRVMVTDIIGWKKHYVNRWEMFKNDKDNVSLKVV